MLQRGREQGGMRTLIAARLIAASCLDPAAPVLLTVDERGTVFLEVHRDVYGRVTSAADRMAHLLRSAGLPGLTDAPAVRRILREQEGRAVLVKSSADPAAVENGRWR